MAEDDCADAEGATSGGPPGRVGVYFCGRGLQPGADAESAIADSSVRVSRGRCVSKIAKWRSWAHSNTYENATFRVLGSDHWRYRRPNPVFPQPPSQARGYTRLPR